MANVKVCKRCRREGTRLFLKGARCETVKCSLERKKSVPGMHGRGRRMKVTEYGMQLREKQKLKTFYGVSEKQFRTYYAKSERKRGNTGENLLQMFERRLDNVVFLLSLAESRRHSRQLISHGHVQVNGKRVDIGSFLVSPEDLICIKEKSRGEAIEKVKSECSWLQADEKNFGGKVLNFPSRDDISMPIKEQLVVEFCSK